MSAYISFRTFDSDKTAYFHLEVKYVAIFCSKCSNNSVLISRDTDTAIGFCKEHAPMEVLSLKLRGYSFLTESLARQKFWKWTSIDLDT